MYPLPPFCFSGGWDKRMWSLCSPGGVVAGSAQHRGEAKLLAMCSGITRCRVREDAHILPLDSPSPEQLLHHWCRVGSSTHQGEPVVSWVCGTKRSPPVTARARTCVLAWSGGGWQRSDTMLLVLCGEITPLNGSRGRLSTLASGYSTLRETWPHSAYARSTRPSFLFCDVLTRARTLISWPPSSHSVLMWML
jgi:hypothetical protein